MFVTTKYFCHDLVATKVLLTSILLAQQKMCFVMANTGLFCHNFFFVMTKICFVVTKDILKGNDKGLGCGVKHGSGAQVDVYYWQELPQV